ncbi:hypothetical protein BH11PSE4_BH11PSE4_24480 [soil metagenome]
MKILIAAAAVAIAAATCSPASAMMACTSANMMKSLNSDMADGPGKMGMMKEMAMANTQMSKGDMKGACRSYMKAQKMAMMKSAM